MNASFDEQGLRHALQTWHGDAGLNAPTPTHPVLVAYSGGVDSTALLGMAQRLWPTAVRAVHVNHNLQTQAATFEAHCRHWCAEHAIPLTVCKGTVCCQSGDSTEEQARLFRYRQLADAAHQHHAQTVLLAHHADDQAETVLLALTRGAGLAGLAGMGTIGMKHGVVFGRPWLGVRQRDLKVWVQAQRWSYIDDPSNEDTRFTRNKIRHQMLPKIERLFPEIVTSLQRTARHCAQADALLHQLTVEDLATVLNADGYPLLLRLQQLSTSRLALVLRLWLKTAAGRTPSTAQLDELSKQVRAARTRGHHIRLKAVDGYVLRRHEHLIFERIL